MCPAGESKRQLAALAVARNGDGATAPRLAGEYLVVPVLTPPPKPRAVASSFVDVDEEDDAVRATESSREQQRS